MTPKCWDKQMSNIENQLNRLESLFEENPRYLLKIQNLLLKNGIILKSGDRETRVQSVEEVQEHVKLTFHSNSPKSTEAVHHFSGNASHGVDVNCIVEDGSDPAKDEMSMVSDPAKDEMSMVSNPAKDEISMVSVNVELMLQTKNEIKVFDEMIVTTKEEPGVVMIKQPLLFNVFDAKFIKKGSETSVFDQVLNERQTASTGQEINTIHVRGNGLDEFLFNNHIFTVNGSLKSKQLSTYVFISFKHFDPGIFLSNPKKTMDIIFTTVNEHYDMELDEDGVLKDLRGELFQAFVSGSISLCQLKLTGFSIEIRSFISLLSIVKHYLKNLLVVIEWKHTFSASLLVGAEVTTRTVLEALRTEQCLELFSLEMLESIGDTLLEMVVDCHPFLLHDLLNEEQLTRSLSVNTGYVKANLLYRPSFLFLIDCLIHMHLNVSILKFASYLAKQQREKIQAVVQQVRNIASDLYRKMKTDVVINVYLNEAYMTIILLKWLFSQRFFSWGSIDMRESLQQREVAIKILEPEVQQIKNMIEAQVDRNRSDQEFVVADLIYLKTINAGIIHNDGLLLIGDTSEVVEVNDPFRFRLLLMGTSLLLYIMSVGSIDATLNLEINGMKHGSKATSEMIFHSLISTACNFNRSIHSFYHTEEALKHGSKATNEAIWLDAKMEIKITNKVKDGEIIIVFENDVFEKYYSQHLLFMFSQIVPELLQHLVDLCFVVDALETYVKEVLVYNFFSIELSPFERIREGIELAKLDKRELRYDWIKRKIFPNSCLVVYPLSIQRTLELKEELAEKFVGSTQSIDFGTEIKSSGRAHLNVCSIFNYQIFNPWGQGFFGGEGIVMTLENWEQEEGNKGLMRSELDDIVSFDVKIPNARDILMNHVTVEMDHISEHDLRLNDETKMNAECFTVLGSSRLPQC